MSLSLLIFSLFGLEKVKNDTFFQIKEREKLLFKEKFPNLPPVSVLEQLEGMQYHPYKKSVLDLLKKALEQLPKSGIKIYKIKYRNGCCPLRVKLLPKL